MQVGTTVINLENGISALKFPPMIFGKALCPVISQLDHSFNTGIPLW